MLWLEIQMQIAQIKFDENSYVRIRLNSIADILNQFDFVQNSTLFGRNSNENTKIQFQLF